MRLRKCHPEFCYTEHDKWSKLFKQVCPRAMIVAHLIYLLVHSTFVSHPIWSSWAECK